MSKDTDHHAAPSPSVRKGPGYTNNPKFREDAIALMIEQGDAELYGMLDGQKLADKLAAVCHLYARIVMGHEDDQNCDLVLEELRSAGLEVPNSGTCD